MHPYDPTTAERQIARTCACAASATSSKCRRAARRLVEVAGDTDENIMPVTIELVRAGATMGDIVERLKSVWGG